MDYKCATLQEAQNWARRLPFKTDAPIQIVFSTGGLRTGAVRIPRTQFLAGFAAYAVFNYDPETKCAKLLGALTNAKLPATGGMVFVRLKELSPLLIRQTTRQPQKPLRDRPGEFTFVEAESAVRLRFRALQDPKGEDATRLMQDQRAETVSRNIARTAASLLNDIDEWMRSETRLCERFLSLNDIDLDRVAPGATTSGAAAKFQQLFNCPISWVGPVPFELVPPNIMRAHQAVLVRGSAYVPLYALKRAAARIKAAEQLRPVDNPLRQFPHDPRIRALCKLWIKLLQAESVLCKPIPLTSLPACMQVLMTERYPEHKHRLVATNVLSRLGHADTVDRLLLPGWAPLIERKHPSTAEHKKKEIARTVLGLSKTFQNASYSCGWMQTNGLCPHFRFPENTPAAALQTCFAKKGVPAKPSPVEFVKGS